jgi:ABC-type phosphate/phosphonate transport system permease subunit
VTIGIVGGGVIAGATNANITAHAVNSIGASIAALPAVLVIVEICFTAIRAKISVTVSEDWWC